MFRRFQRLLVGPVSGALLLMMTACTTVPGEERGWQPTFTNTTWDLVKLAGEVTGELEASRVPHLILTDDGRIFGFSGCNRFQGQYEVSGGRFQVARLASTRMACPEDRLEPSFFAALGEADTVSMDKDRLMLRDAREQPLMTLKARPPR